MTGIDWSKAPEDYPLWLEGTGESHRKYSGWYREAGEVFQGADGGQWRACREGQFFIVHRKPHQVLWDGEGLPPVGTVCEQQTWINREWRTITVAAHFNNYAVCVWEESQGDCQVELAPPGDLRPLRTAEQIADEERQRALAVMLKDSIGEDGSAIQQAIARRLYEAGYRKVQP